MLFLQIDSAMPFRYIPAEKKALLTSICSPKTKKPYSNPHLIMGKKPFSHTNVVTGKKPCSHPSFVTGKGHVITIDLFVGVAYL